MFSRANPTGWVQGDKLTPPQINQIDVNQSRAIDGTAGGIYSPTETIRIQGSSGLEIGGTGNAAWVQLSDRPVIISHPLSIAVANPNVGPGGNVPSAQIVVSDNLTIMSSLGINPGTPCIQTPPNATSAAQASWFVLELQRPPDGSVLQSVTLRTKGQGVFPSGSPAGYTLVMWNYFSYYSIGNSVTVPDNHDASNWTLVRDQTIARQVSLATVNVSALHYGVLVTNPYAPASAGCSLRICETFATYGVTVHKF
jgi:hypothetical protein